MTAVTRCFSASCSTSSLTGHEQLWEAEVKLWCCRVKSTQLVCVLVEERRLYTETNSCRFVLTEWDALVLTHRWRADT